MLELGKKLDLEVEVADDDIEVHLIHSNCLSKLHLSNIQLQVMEA
jgi:hypothetical protein